MAHAFDPGAAASFDGIYGLPHSVGEARVVVVPVPWDATTSYRAGTSLGPAAILEASRQVDLFDAETGRRYEAGIAMLPFSDEVLCWNAAARSLAEPVIENGGAGTDPALQRNLDRVNALGGQLNEWVRAQTADLLARGKTPVVLGGDHSSPFGAFQAYADRWPGLGILHFDAHFDLRDAYEGFRWSHASIMFNALEHVPGIARIVHVGIRDFSEAAHETSRRSGGRAPAVPASPPEGGPAARGAGEAGAGGIAGRPPPEGVVLFDIDGPAPAPSPGA